MDTASSPPSSLRRSITTILTYKLGWVLTEPRRSVAVREVPLPGLSADDRDAYYAERLVPSAAFRLTTGELMYYAVTSNSGRTLRRGFCPECGCPVLILIDGQPFLSIPATSLDDPSSYQPEMDIFTSRAQPWHAMNPSLPKFPEMPTPL